MTELQMANLLEFSIIAAFWVLVIFKLLPEARLDAFRQSMFAVRDELFDFAADGNVAFDAPAYVLLRQQMNGFIRYAHHLTAFRMLLTVVMHKIARDPESSGWRKEWEKNLALIDDDSVRASLERFHERALMLAVKRLITGSPLLWAVTLAFMVQLLFQGAAQGARQLIRAASRKAFSGPINDLSIEEVAHGALA